MPLSIQSRIRKLDAFFLRAKEKAEDDELKADLARFGAILTCGFIEKCVETIVTDKLQHRAQPQVLRFISGHFRKGTNYNCEKIGSLLERFDLSWREAFIDFLASNSDVAEAVDSAYALRNSVAHGGDASRGLSSVAEIYSQTKKLVAGLEGACSTARRRAAE